MQTKIEQVLQSRKFWAAAFIGVAAVALYLMGQLDASQLITSLSIAGGVYIGGTALEDGLSAALVSWGHSRPERVFDENDADLPF